MKRRWAWHAGHGLQVLLLLAGLLHWSLAALGVIFGAAWAYAQPRAPQHPGLTHLPAWAAGSEPCQPSRAQPTARHWVIAMLCSSGSWNEAAHSSSRSPRLTARGPWTNVTPLARSSP